MVGSSQSLPGDPNAGFSKNDIDALLTGGYQAFPLKTRELLLVDSLNDANRASQRNLAATALLRNAIDNPRGCVYGNALLLGPDDAERFFRTQRSQTNEVKSLLLLDWDEVFCSVVAFGLERHNFRVIQAPTAVEALGLCQDNTLHFLVADLSSLLPHPLETLCPIREAQSRAKVLVISGYDRTRIANWYPGLLTGTQFLQKPFAFRLIVGMLHVMGRTKNTSRNLQVTPHVQTDSQDG